MRASSTAGMSSIRSHSPSSVPALRTSRGSVSRYGSTLSGWVSTVTVAIRSMPSSTRHSAMFASGVAAVSLMISTVSFLSLSPPCTR